MGSRLREWMQFVFAAALIVVVFNYDGSGSSVLRVVTIGVSGVALNLWITRAIEFEPFAVSIRVLFPLFIDEGMATLDQLRALTAEPNPVGHSPIRDGIRFQLLKVGILTRSGDLVYWPDHNGFSTRISMEYELKELPIEKTLGGYSGYPWFILKHDIEGLSFAVRRNVEEEPRVVAVLPWSEFEIRQWPHGSPQLSAQRLTQLGWSRGTTSLKHKYLHVRWWHI